MKSLDLQSLDLGFAKLSLDSLPHLLAGIDRVRQRKNLIGASMALANQMSNPLDQHRGLAGTGARQHQHRAMNVLDRLTLLGIRLEGVGSPFRNSH